ncbi:MAG: hypothetical protein ABL891_18660 [Burkholderiales bacterium]
MKQISLKVNCVLAIVIAGGLVFGPAIADKPSWAGDKGGKGENREHRDKADNRQGKSHEGDGRSSRDGAAVVRTSERFGERHRTLARDYYNEQYRSGHCPPGLAKKNNGCMPPGQARKWTVGRPLPREVIYYEVPSTLVVQFGQPQAGYRYVRVASDILLIALGTGMVIDAIQDLGR